MIQDGDGDSRDKLRYQKKGGMYEKAAGMRGLGHEPSPSHPKTRGGRGREDWDERFHSIPKPVHSMLIAIVRYSSSSLLLVYMGRSMRLKHVCDLRGASDVQ